MRISALQPSGNDVEDVPLIVLVHRQLRIIAARPKTFEVRRICLATLRGHHQLTTLDITKDLEWLARSEFQLDQSLALEVDNLLVCQRQPVKILPTAWEDLAPFLSVVSVRVDSTSIASSGIRTLLFLMVILMTWLRWLETAEAAAAAAECGPNAIPTTISRPEAA